MVGTIFGALGKTEGSVEVRSVGLISKPTQNWVQVAKVPTTDLVAGHDYLFLATGVIGNWRGSLPRIALAQVEFRLGGSLYFNTPHTADMRFSELNKTVDSSGRTIDGDRGLPFFMPLRTTMTNPAQEVELIARIAVDQAQPGVPSFEVFHPTILALDLTEFQTNTEFVYADYTGPSFDVPYVNQTPSVPASLSRSTTAGRWLMFHAAWLTPKNDRVGTIVSLDDGSSNYHAQNLQPPASGNPAPSSDDHNKQWVGQIQMRDLPASFSMFQRVRCGWSTGLRSRYHRGVIAAVRMHSDFEAFLGNFGQTANFWDFAYRGASVSATASITKAVRYVVGASVNVDLPEGHSPLLEVNGGRVWENKLFGHLKSGAIIANVYVTLFDALNTTVGSHVARVFGERNPRAKLTTQLPGQEIQFFGFGLTSGVVPPKPPLEVPGPVLEVTPPKETPASLATLPAVPVEPSYAVVTRPEMTVREFEARRGYRIVSPKFTLARRVYELRWTGLTSTQVSTLRSWLSDVVSNYGGTFRWRPPDDDADRPWTLETDEWVILTDAEGRGELSLKAIELVVFTP